MRRTRVQAMVHSAMCTALMAVCAQIHIPLPPVPVNMALLAVHLASALLGAKAAAISAAAYALLGAAGLPVFAGLAGGPGVLFGPTGGFIAGYVLCAAVSAQLMRGGRSFGRMCLAMAAGTLCCYALGTAWFMALTGTGLGAAIAACVLPFWPGDAAKIGLAAAVARRMKGRAAPSSPG